MYLEICSLNILWYFYVLENYILSFSFESGSFEATSSILEVSKLEVFEVGKAVY